MFLLKMIVTLAYFSCKSDSLGKDLKVYRNHGLQSHFGSISAEINCTKCENQAKVMNSMEFICDSLLSKQPLKDVMEVISPYITLVYSLCSYLKELK